MEKIAALAIIRAEFQEFVGQKVSVSTVRSSLNNLGLYGWIAWRKPLLNDKHQRKRFDFAKRYQSWTSEGWKKVIFSDESRFQLFCSNGRTYVRWRKSEEFNENCVVSTVKHSSERFGDGMGMSLADGVGGLARMTTNMDSAVYQDTLEQHLLSRVAPSSRIFQQDNSPHMPRSMRQWFSAHKIEVLDWPAQSPDLNPIENLWDIISRRRQSQTWRKPDELWERICHIWNTMLITITDQLIQSIPCHL